MRKPRPWWETYPGEYWTAEDWKAARKAGVVPPLPELHIDPAMKLAYESSAKTAVIGGLYAGTDSAGERRSKADAALAAHGIRPRRS